ncbi:hypothetical protein BBO99_00008101 [Phytophthora kernoviae]|uniref:Uncharacterized protein n=2 Tax=Phytophthora kernoviae TaxID=325452 RepID=A0A3R7KQR0_9STRA|nr:hypothetical protein G195_009984 [Phytophthora kernoviae 00238/432]KAG2515420.1 hypothetical protein JM16_007730 [Phytophthora kernoviae]KAG2519213.1 hypothetical protein JM18_007629 [Phytophthora kernoviae]RLN10515.1 hypothetical protein BBI17_008030 [Phytophthora kernoviae]RLN75747.1 hypothetical protein BBO99_00008101 [Phytophthora kernoviae]
MAKTGEAEQERRAVELDVAASQARTEPVKALAMSTDVSPSPTMLETRFLLCIKLVCDRMGVRIQTRSTLDDHYPEQD